MADYITLSCPSCGGRLDITADVERFACAHCGNEHVVKRGGGIVALAPVVAGLKQVQVGVDKTASELAIKRLKEELIILQAQRQRIAAKLSGKLLSISADLETKVAALNIGMLGGRRLAKQLAFPVMLVSGIAFLCIFVLSAGSHPTVLAITLISIVIAVITMVCVVTMNWPDEAPEMQLAQARHDAEEQTGRERTEVEGILATLDTRISKMNEELERHRQVVSQ